MLCLRQCGKAWPGPPITSQHGCHHGQHLSLQLPDRGEHVRVDGVGVAVQAVRVHEELPVLLASHVHGTRDCAVALLDLQVLGLLQVGTRIEARNVLSGRVPLCAYVC